MTLDRMFERWKEQTGYDDDDSEVQDRVVEFLNEGMTQIALKRLSDDVSDLVMMEADNDEPDPRIPSWTHPIIVDYALYLWYRDGNAVKQQRATMYLHRFNTILTRMPSLKDEEQRRANGGRWDLRNLYTH